MPTCSITRLRLRRALLLPGFVIHSKLSSRQAVRSRGFGGGYLAIGPRLTFWTVTLWDDEQAMRAFRRSGRHLAAMPKLLDWCDEAAVATIAAAELPQPDEAARRLAAEGRLSKVRRPSPRHAAGAVWPDRAVPRRARTLTPA